jgi:hypothetical protein
MADGAQQFEDELAERLQGSIGEERFRALTHGLGALERILPHLKIEAPWHEPNEQHERSTAAVALRLRLPGDVRRVETRLVGRTASAGVASTPLKIGRGERAVAAEVISQLATDLSVDQGHAQAELERSFDERVVSQVLQKQRKLTLNPRTLLDALHDLSCQTYENRLLTFGILVDPEAALPGGANDLSRSLATFLERKRYRALSDGYRVVYRLTADGRVVDLRDLSAGYRRSRNPGYFPEWARYCAEIAKQKRVCLALTRGGDIVIFARGGLFLSYRAGTWRYWNHDYIVELVKNRARTQRVMPDTVGRLVATLYRLALDVSFRHVGGLIVVLRRERDLGEVVRSGDAIGSNARKGVDKAFDQQFKGKLVQSLPPFVLAQIAGIDGALVVANSGRLLAYGAVLEPQEVEVPTEVEGARTRAAIGASRYGLAIKISSEGPITFYQNDAEFLKI